MKKILKIVLPFIGMLTLADAVYAAPPPQLSEITVVIDNARGYIFPLGFFVAFCMMVYGGYLWLLSSGDPQKTQKAQGTLTWAVIGLIFLGIFRFLVYIVLDFLQK